MHYKIIIDKVYNEEKFLEFLSSIIKLNDKSNKLYQLPFILDDLSLKLKDQYVKLLAPISDFDIKNKQEISCEMMKYLINEIVKSPPNQAELYVRVEAKEALDKGLEKFSNAQLFDICQKIGDREVGKEIHPFVKAVYNLKEFYVRPE